LNNITSIQKETSKYAYSFFKYEKQNSEFVCYDAIGKSYAYWNSEITTLMKIDYVEVNGGWNRKNFFNRTNLQFQINKYEYSKDLQKVVIECNQGVFYSKDRVVASMFNKKFDETILCRMLEDDGFIIRLYFAESLQPFYDNRCRLLGSSYNSRDDSQDNIDNNNLGTLCSFRGFNSRIGY
jgi:hypothetical protein